MKLRTCTSVVLDHLRSLPPNTKFTSVGILDVLSGPNYPQVNQSAVSAFLSNLDTVQGAIAVVGTERNPETGRTLHVYQVLDLNNVDVSSYMRTQKVPNVSVLADELVLLAEKVRLVKTSIEDYTTDDLLKELRRRTA